jgi:arginine N-succinyltransferase
LKPEEPAVFVMRRARTEDVPTLLKLAKMVHFINLPADKDIIADKAVWSRHCFLKAALAEQPKSSKNGKHGSTKDLSPPRTADRGAGPLHGMSMMHSSNGKGSEDSGLAAAVSRSDLFMFVLEDTESNGVLGTSQIISKMGGPGRPNVSFRLTKKEMFSNTLQMGVSHMVAKLHLDESGPTEIGGLILQPSYRGHKGKLGRFLSLVRFHFIGLHRAWFSERIIAEMMAPITPDGRNTLWEYLGRRFINLTYTEADSFCQYSKEFITALLPREEIYLTLLPPEARSVIAQVGPETLPARRMLEKLGFAYRDLVDCFDGGPTLEANTADISTIRQTKRLTLGEPARESDLDTVAIVSTLDADGEFRAVQTPCCVDAQRRVRLQKPCYEHLQAQPGTSVGFTPLEGRESAREAPMPDAATNGHTTKASRKPAKRQPQVR